MRNKVRILVVDDLPQKRAAVIAALQEALHPIRSKFEQAACYEEARDKLKESYYDVVVLDIMIPAGQQEPSEAWSRQLLKEILDGKVGAPIHVFGITEHKEIEAEERLFYEENMFSFELFDWANTDWARRIGARIRYLVLASDAGLNFHLNGFNLDILVLVARHDNEFLPVRDALFGAKKSLGHPNWRDRSHFGIMRTSGNIALDVGVVCIGETGLAPSAAVTAQAINVLRPRLVVMLGMCAGFEKKGLKILDIIVARDSACWQEGKFLEADKKQKFDARSKVRSAPPEIRKLLDAVVEEYEQGVGALMQSISAGAEYLKVRQLLSGDVRAVPEVKLGTLVSGSAVVGSSNIIDDILSRFQAAIGLEMEVFGVYTAVEKCIGRTPLFFAIKGVADFGDGNKKDHAQKLASSMSAELFKFVVGKIGKAVWASG